MVHVVRLYKATDDIEVLSAKHRQTWDVQRSLERLLALGNLHIPYGGLKFKRAGADAKIYKAKVPHPDLGGKSSGLRCVYERVVINDIDYAVVLMISLHQGGKSEQDNRSVLKRRFVSFEATIEGLRNVDSVDTESYFLP